MLCKIKRILSLLFLFVIVFRSEVHAATPAGLACLNSRGEIIIRKKCNKGETRLSALSLGQKIASSQPATSGLMGSTGKIGAEGVAGPAGEQGVQGKPGITGNVGAIGPQGAQGQAGLKGPVGNISLADCRLTNTGYVSNFVTPSNPILYAQVFCNQNTEYLLQDESIVGILPGSEGTKAALQGRLPYHHTITGDTREYGVGIYANRFTTVGIGAFELSVRGVCCPR